MLFTATINITILADTHDEAKQIAENIAKSLADTHLCVNDAEADDVEEA